MLILNLTRGDSGIRVPLHLPATPADVGDVYAKLDQISKKEKLTRIAGVVSDSNFLERYFRDKLLDPLDELNELAERLDGIIFEPFRNFSNGAAVNRMVCSIPFPPAMHTRYFKTTHDVTSNVERVNLSSCMVSAVLLRDLLCGKPNPYARVFDPGRLSWQAASGIVSEGWQAAKGLGKNLFQIPSAQAAELTPGHGGIVFLRGKKAGVFRNEKGEIHAVKLRCPHLGCQLEWNPDECSWDCPCHGSRFDHRGGLISGPAQERLGPGAD